ncbi:MAG: SulP family inorganic anion transporter [Aureispira sp.]|nr:SulP family inorganic anion transporter [Aureispira sp.]
MSDFSINTITKNFKDDFLAAFSVALVALPLGLGVAIACGVPPMAGIIAAITGGLVTTLFKGGHVSINGPAAGLIVVILAGMESMQDDTLASGFQYVMAATVIAGGFQMILGLLKMGKFADMIPSSVIQGMLAAIGVIIVGKQLPLAFGVKPEGLPILQELQNLPEYFINQNPFVGLITLICLLVLLLHPKIKSKLVHIIPAPIWVLMFSIPFVFIFNFFDTHPLTLFEKSYIVSKEYLVQVPSNVMASLMFPNFSKIGEFDFWFLVLTLTVIASIQTLVIAKAVDNIDEQKRKTNLNKDLFAVGLGSTISGAIGGLPLITVIVRSSVNVQNGAKTRWSNFYHGLILLVLVLFFAGFIQVIPLAALASLLIFTGYKLASPKAFKDTYRKGWEQLAIMIVTLIITLKQDLLIGIVAGTITTFIIHVFQSKIPFKEFIRLAFKPYIITTEFAHTKEYYVRTKGILSFLSILRLKTALRKVPNDQHLILDVSRSNIVDYTVLEYLHNDAEKYDVVANRFDLVGLDVHETSSRHPNSLHVLRRNKRTRRTKRQDALDKLSHNFNGRFLPETSWDVAKYKQFEFFKTRPIEYKINTTKGHYHNGDVLWESCDLIFDEGALFASQEYHTSIIHLLLPNTIPTFVLEEEGWLDKLGIKLSLKGDIDFQEFPHFSDNFLLHGEDESAIRAFFTPALIQYLDNQQIYHIESTGDAMVIFKDMRFASPKEIEAMHLFAKELLLEILEDESGTDKPPS